MDRFVRASSAVLDYLWQGEDFSAYFYEHYDYDLRAAAKLVPDVFRQAYIDFRAAIPDKEREAIQQEVIDTLMLDMVRNPGFIDIWRSWDEAYREQFLEQQAEEPLGLRLAERYPSEASRAYRSAFEAWMAAQQGEDA